MKIRSKFSFNNLYHRIIAFYYQLTSVNKRQKKKKKDYVYVSTIIKELFRFVFNLYINRSDENAIGISDQLAIFSL